MGYFKTKVTEDAEDQKPRGEKPIEGRTPIQLEETSERLRPAECAAKEGEYINGQCY